MTGIRRRSRLQHEPRPPTSHQASTDMLSALTLSQAVFMYARVECAQIINTIFLKIE
jgi:hypothetical protein